MPIKTWDTQVDWQQWALTHLEATPAGNLEIEAGYNIGTAQSPPYECASWDHYSKLVLQGSIPQGCNVYCRFRSGATQGACESAPWSKYINGFDSGGTMIFDLQVEILNEAYPVGAWIQFEVTLVGV